MECHGHHRNTVVCSFLLAISLTVLGLSACGSQDAEASGDAAGGESEIVIHDDAYTGTDGYNSVQNGLEAGNESESTEETLSAEQEEWQHYLMPHAEQYVNVREKPDENADVVGKLYMGSRAWFEKKGTEWTKIESGQVSGYVKNEFCYFGNDALEWAKRNCDTMAEVTGEGVRVRSSEDQDASILALVPNGQAMLVDPYASTGAGWVGVLLDDQDATGYVRSDLVKIYYKTTKGITIEAEESSIAESESAVQQSIWDAEYASKEAESIAQASRDAESRAAAEKAEAAKKKSGSSSQAKKSSGNSSSSSGSSSSSSSSGSGSDVRLLAALIQCEAGGEPYEGQIAVGAVVMNRVASGRFPNSIRGVVYQSGQFTPAGSGDVDRVLAAGPRSSCIKAAKSAMNGTDNTGGALYFGRSARGSIKASIGHHVFY